MKKKIALILCCPEITGMVFGLGILATWGISPLYLITPTLGLLALVMLGLLAGFIVGGVSSRRGNDGRLSVQCGARAATWAVLVAAALIVLMARFVPSAFSPLRSLLVAGASVLPAIFAGAISATIGMLLFRKDDAEGATPHGVEDLAFSKWLTRLLRVAMIGVITLGVSAPFYPKSAPLVMNKESASSYAPLPFAYTTPDALKSAPPIAWRVLTQRNVGALNPSAGVALTSDEKSVIALDGDSVVVAQTLDKDGGIRVETSPWPIKRLALSPDSHRVFVVMASDPLRIGVADLMTHRFILLPQPKKHAVPEASISWWKEKQILFVLNNKEQMELDLDSLELSPLPLTNNYSLWAATKASLGLPSTDAWTFSADGFLLSSSELPETEGTSQWWWRGHDVLRLADKVHRQSRLFSEIELERSDLLVGVSDGSKLLRFRNGNLQIFYFDTRPIPSLRWKIEMPHGPEKMREKDASNKALALGDLSMVLYAPLKNPLTLLTIGPDRERPKSILRFAKWEGTEAEVFIATDNLPYSPGDVLADVHTGGFGGMPLQLVSLELAHRWWTLTPEPLADSDDISKLPTVAENEKRRADIEAAAEKEAKALAEAKAVERAAPTTPNPQPQAYDLELMKTYEKEVLAFVLEHHAKASKGKVAEVVADYAEQVDHFNNGIVGRAFILKDETDYHRAYNSIHEQVRNNFVWVHPRAKPPFVVTYIMENEWQKKDGSKGSGVFDEQIVVDKINGQWRIIKHRAEIRK